jgi:glycosyltransferase involved in cell wall biosynthesis
MRAYEALILACRELADAGHDFLLFAFDTGQQEHPIWKLVERLKLLDRISFVPFHHEAEPLLLHGDLYLHVLPTSRVQYRTLEAMARGLAVVTCPNPGADYLVEGQTCRHVREQSSAAWRAALGELLTDRPRASALARQAQQLMRDRHPMARAIEQFTTICHQVAGTPIKLPT